MFLDEDTRSNSPSNTLIKIAQSIERFNNHIDKQLSKLTKI